MKILFNSTYEDLLGQIKQGDDSIRDHLQKEKDLERELENEVLQKGQVQKENDKLIKTNVNLLEQCDSLKLQVEHLQESLITMSKKLQSSYAKNGGLKKQNNKLSSELVKIKCILESYKDCHDKIHPKKTVNQYDKRLKAINKRKK